MPVSLKTRLDRFLIYLAPLRRIADAMQLKADGGDIIAWLSLLKVFGPNLDLGSDSIMVRQYPPIMGFDRDILPLDILRRGGRPGGAMGIGQDLDDGGLIASRELPGAARSGRALSARTTSQSTCGF